jgi:hypothetical protein
MTMLILDTFSSNVASTTNGTFGTSLYRFWTIAWIFYANHSNFSLSFKYLWAFASASPFSFKSFDGISNNTERGGGGGESVLPTFSY